MSGDRGNPYNPRDPIKDPDYFIGREDELELIDYDLSLALADRPQYTNIGITGEEGAGKSSLSFMVRHASHEKGILNVRIALDEGDTNDEITLFRKIFDGITNEVGGKLRDSFLNWIKGVTDQIEIDLQFARIYLSPQSNVQSDEVLDSTIREDLVTLFDGIDNPAISIIIDNAQDLTDNKIILQKIKNIFTEVEGYILILVGTENTFSEINTAFSPTARIFDKIEIGPFESVEETEECLRKPLSKDEVKLLDDRTIREIHRLTGGRPFEINLIGFHMYRQYAREGEEFLSLSSDVIDSVVHQLEEWRDNIDGDLPEIVNNLSNNQIRILISAIELGEAPRAGVINYTLLSLVNTTRIGNISDKHQSLGSELNSLLDQNLLEVNNNDLISFPGDNYLLAYLKYFSISNGVVDTIGPSQDNIGTIHSTERAISNIHYRIVDEQTLEGIPNSHSHFIPDTEKGKYDPSLRSIRVDDKGEHHAGFADRSISIMELEDEYFHESQIASADTDHADIDYEEITFRCNVKWLNSGFISIIHFEDTENKRAIKDSIFSIQDRLESLGFRIILDDEKSMVRKGHEEAENGDFENALEYANKAIDVNPNYPLGWYNRAFVYWKLDDIEQAIDDINQTIELRGDWIDAHLQKAKFHLEMGEREQAVNSFREAIQIDPGNPDIPTLIACELSGHGKPELVRDYANQAISLDENNVHARFHLAQAHYQLDNFRESLDECGFIRESDADTGKIEAGLSYMMGMCLSELVPVSEDLTDEEVGQIEEAIRLLSKSLELADDEDQMANIYYNRACAYAKIGKVDPVLDDLQNAILSFSDYAELAKDDDDFDRIRGTEEWSDFIDEYVG